MTNTEIELFMLVLLVGVVVFFGLVAIFLADYIIGRLFR